MRRAFRYAPPSVRRAARTAALAAGALVAASCFEGDVPTKQIGGTEFGLLLGVPAPLRLPSMTSLGYARTATPAVLDSLVVTLTNLKPLTGKAAYRFYAVGAGAGDTVPVAARLTALRRDSTPAPTGPAGAVIETTDSTELGTSTFLRGTPPNVTVRARFAGAQFGGAARQFLVVTIQADSTAPAFAAATPRPLWLRYRNATAPNNVIVPVAPGNAPVSSIFGKFDLVSPVPFSPLGRGRSAFWDRDRTMRLQYAAIVEGLTQPPLGYYYQPWLRDTRTRRAVAFGDLVELGTTNSLHDADLLTIPGSVAQLPPARFATSEDELGQALMTFDGVHLVLEPKLGDNTLSLATVLLGTIGDTLGLRGVGAIEIIAMKGATPVPGVIIVAKAVGANLPVGNPSPAQTAGSDPRPELAGHVIISRIPAGQVELIITPPAGFTGPAQNQVVTVQRGDTTTVNLTLQ